MCEGMDWETSLTRQSSSADWLCKRKDRNSSKKVIIVGGVDKFSSARNDKDRRAWSASTIVDAPNDNYDFRRDDLKEWEWASENVSETTWWSTVSSALLPTLRASTSITSQSGGLFPEYSSSFEISIGDIHLHEYEFGGEPTICECKKPIFRVFFFVIRAPGEYCEMVLYLRLPCIHRNIK